MMKKFLLGAAAFSLLFAVSCKKSDDNNSVGNWKLGGTTYGATSTDSTTSGNTYVLYANDANANEISFTFNSTMPVTGTYKVVSFFSLFVTTGNNVAIQTLALPSTAYASTGNDNINASVTVNSGKVAISVPSVWMKNQNGNDSLQLTATVTQK
ncbi:hypothetical protein ACTHGU_18995 [Chitinophagaceae bacterium MMS25-I14]